jgi:hypothetical protein
MYCICCKQNNIKPLQITGENLPEEELLWKKDVNSAMIDGGIIQTVDAGYGSIHDGDQFVLGICDICVKENLDNGYLLYFGNYMYPQDEEIEKSKIKFRRSNNLDKLI